MRIPQRPSINYPLSRNITSIVRHPAATAASQNPRTPPDRPRLRSVDGGSQGGSVPLDIIRRNIALPRGIVGDGCATGQVRSDCVSCVVDAVAVDSNVGESYDGGGEGEACC